MDDYDPRATHLAVDEVLSPLGLHCRGVVILRTRGSAIVCVSDHTREAELEIPLDEIFEPALWSIATIRVKNAFFRTDLGLEDWILDAARIIELVKQEYRSTEPDCVERWRNLEFN